MAFLLELQGDVSNKFKSFGGITFCSGKVKLNEPVRHSTNLKPSRSAIDSIIFELTVEATIASFSGDGSALPEADNGTCLTHGRTRRLVQVKSSSRKEASELVAREDVPSTVAPAQMSDWSTDPEQKRLFTGALLLRSDQRLGLERAHSWHLMLQPS